MTHRTSEDCRLLSNAAFKNTEEEKTESAD